MQERKIKCPQCGRLTVYSLENPARPFCSDRCKLIDLGQWADETYRVPTPINPIFNNDLNTDEFNQIDALEDDIIAKILNPSSDNEPT